MGNELPRRQRPRFWDGKTVHFANKGMAGIFDRRQWELGLTEGTARSLALALARLKQTSVTLPDDCEEILQALNYVLVADPASVAAHRQMEAGKGMTPDGGHKAPAVRRPLRDEEGSLPIHLSLDPPRPRRTDWRDEGEFGPRSS